MIIIIKKIVAIILSVFMFGMTYSNNNLSFIEKTRDTSITEGVTREELTGTTYNDRGIAGNQNINILRQGDDIEVVNWSRRETGRFRKADTIEIARNFERENPEFEVIAGVNGDFFNLKKWEVETENASIIYGNRTLNIVNGPNSAAVEFDLDGSFKKMHKEISFNDSIVLELYDSRNALKYQAPVKSVNSKLINGSLSY